MSNNILIKNGRYVVSSAYKIIEDGAVYIEDGKIKDIGKSKDLKKYSPEEVIDAQNKIVMPGLVDAHSHLCEAHTYIVFSLLKSPLRDIFDALDRVWWPAYSWLTEEKT